MTVQTKFDEKLADIAELTWLPWIGEAYEQGGVLVLGESHYCYLDMLNWKYVGHFQRQTRIIRR